MLFIHAQTLWLLLLSPVLAVAGWRASRRDRLITALLRAAAVACLVLAIAEPLRISPHQSPVRVAVIDLSPTVADASIADAARTAPADVRWVAFSNRATSVVTADELLDAERRATLRRTLAAPLRADDPPAGGAALADALQLAGALIPSGADGEISLFCNGLQTRGDAAGEATRLAARHLALRVHDQPVHTDRDCLARRLELPASGRVGQTLAGTLVVETNRSVTVTVTLHDGSEPLLRRDVQLANGVNDLAVTIPLLRSGLHQVTAAIESPHADPTPVLAAVEVGQRPVVRVVRDMAAPDSTAAALRSILGSTATVEEAEPSTLDTPAGLDGTGLFVLGNLPADRLSLAAQTNLHDAVVRDGASLMLCGGESSFGAAGYGQSTVLEPMLPVQMPRPAEQLDPTVALVMVIDTSGSMKGNRLDIAKEIARLAIGRLTPHDKAGIVEFYGNRRWASPLETVGDKLDIDRALDRLSAGGGTILYPAVEEAAFALRNVSARNKHVLILSDGDVENTPFETLTRQMARDGITVSTGRCGNANGRGDFLSNIAHWGRGRYYEAGDRFSLPDVTFKRPRLLPLSPLVLTPERVSAGSDPLAAPFAGVAGAEIDRYVRTPSKPTADVLLDTAAGDPLLARWRYGAGWVVTFSTDPSTPAATSLEQTPAFANLFRSLVQDVAGGRSTLRVRPRLRPAGLEVDVDALTPSIAAAAPLVLSLERDGHNVATAEVPAMTSGHWNALFPTPVAGTYRVLAVQQQTGASPAVGTGSAAVAVPAPRALDRLTPDRDLLDSIATPTVDNFSPNQSSPLPPAGGVQPLWIPLALLSIILFLSHIAVRRWPAPRAPAAKSPGRSPAGSDLAAVTPRAGAWMTAGCLAMGALVLPAPTARAAASSQPIAIAQRIHSALSNDGDLTALAEELSRARPTTPVQQRSLDRDIAAVAWEQGDLGLLRKSLDQITGNDPGDAEASARLAFVDELLGEDVAAEQLWRRLLSMPLPANQAESDRLRLALLLLDWRKQADGTAALTGASSTPTGRLAGSVIATMYGDPTLTGRLLSQTAGQESAAASLEHVLLGEADLRLNQSAAAAAAFRAARDASPSEQDQRYLAEREVAAARQGGTLQSLADRWVVEGDDLPVACVTPLVGVLRETHQVDQLLNWWKHWADSGNAQHQQAALSPGVLVDVMGAAADDGRVEQVESISQQLLNQDPGSVAALNAALRVALDLGDGATADRLLQHEVDASTRGEDLSRLGRLALSLGRFKLAQVCADRLLALRTTDAVTGLLLQADVSAQQANPAGQTRALQLAAAQATEPAQAISVADALDAAGQRPAAIALLQRIVQSTPAGDDLAAVREQLAWYLEKANRLDEAETVYQQIWSNADTAAARTQDEQHLIELADHTDRLPSLVQQQQAKLQTGLADRADLSLLVEAQVHENSVDAAVGEVNSSPLAGSKTDRLRWIAALYLRTDHLDQAESALQQLSDAQRDDPDAQRLTLQKIAEVELKRGRLDLARSAIDAAGRDSDAATSATMLADILSRSARPGSAAKQYRRALAAFDDTAGTQPNHAANENDGSDWLLWAQAMDHAGKKEQATARLALLCADAGASGHDALLGIGVDGLLNLGAPPVVLRAVRRVVLLRAATNPRRVLYDHLLADLSDALRDAPLGRRALELSLAEDTEARSQNLRQLIELANAEGDSSAALDYGARLLSLGEDLPPSLFLELAQQMLADGKDAEAEGALARATQISTDDAVRERAAGMLQRASQPLKAARLLAPVVERNPADATLQLQLAALYDSAGEAAHARTRYLSALDLALVRLPEFLTTGQGDDGSSNTVRNAGARTARSATMAPEPPVPLPDQLSASLIGALSCSESDAARAEVVDRIASSADQWFTAADKPRAPVDTDDQPAGGAHADVDQPSPVLLLAATLLRQASFSARTPDVADAFDRRLLQRWPHSITLRSTAVQTRLYWGLFDRADRFAAGLPSLPPLLSVRRAVAVASRAPSAAVTQPSAPSEPGDHGANQTSADAAAFLLPQLLVRQCTTQAARVLSASAPPESAVSPLTPMIIMSAAHQLGRQDLVDAQALRWAKSATRPVARRGTRDTGENPGVVAVAQNRNASNFLTTIWPIISPDVRSNIAAQFGQAAEHLSSPVQASLMAGFTLAAARDDDRPCPNAAVLLSRLAAQSVAAGSFQGGQPVWTLWDDVSPEIQATLAPLVFSAPAQMRNEKTWPFECVGNSNAPLAPAVINAITAAVTASASVEVAGPPSANNSADSSREASRPWTAWFANTAQTNAVAQVCGAMLTPPSNVSPAGAGSTESTTDPLSSFPAAPDADQALPPAAAPLDLQTLVSAAAGLSLTGHPGQADLLARQAVDRLRTEPPTDVDRDLNLAENRWDEPVGGSHSLLLKCAVAALSDRPRQQLLDSLRAGRADDIKTGGWQAAADALLMDDLGQREISLALLRQAVAANPQDRDVLAALQRRCVDDGRESELVTLLQSRLYDTGAIDPQLVARLTAAMSRLGRFDRVRRFNLFDDLFPEALSLELQAAFAAGDFKAVAVASRGILVSARQQNVSPLSYTLPSPPLEGLTAAQPEEDQDARTANRVCLPASDSGGVDALLRELEAQPPSKTSSVQPIAQMLCNAAASDASVREQLVSHYLQLQSVDALTVNDWEVIQRLALTPGVRLSQELRDVIWDGSLLPNTPARATMVPAFTTQGASAAADAAEAWVVSLLQTVGHRFDGWSIDSLSDARLFFPVIPPASASEVLAAGSRPGESIRDEVESRRLLTLIADGRRSQASGEFDKLVRDERIGPETHPLTWLAGARVSADNGDVAGFHDRLREAISRRMWSGNDTALDITRAFPLDGESPLAVAAIQASTCEVIDAFNRQWPGEPCLCSELCELGAWCVDRGDRKSAEQVLQKSLAYQSALGGGVYELCISDLASRLNDSETSTRIEARMLEEQRLPIARVEPLLEHVKASQQPARFAHLSFDAALMLHAQ